MAKCLIEITLKTKHHAYPPQYPALPMVTKWLLDDGVIVDDPFWVWDTIKESFQTNPGETPRELVQRICSGGFWTRGGMFYPAHAIRTARVLKMGVCGSCGAELSEREYESNFFADDFGNETPSYCDDCYKEECDADEQEAREEDEPALCRICRRVLSDEEYSENFFEGEEGSYCDDCFRELPRDG